MSRTTGLKNRWHGKVVLDRRFPVSPTPHATSYKLVEIYDL